MEMIDVYVNEMLMEIVIGLILVAIIGAASALYVLIKCVHKQAQDMKVMKKATSFVFRRLVQETKSLHPEQVDEIEDLEKTYKDLIDES